MTRPQILTITLALILATAAMAQDITVHAKTRITFDKNASSKVVHGFIGGEQHDEWLLYVKKGQKITITVTKGLKTLQPDFAFLKQANAKKPIWTGIAKKNGDIEFDMYAHPDSHYQFKVEVH